MFKDTNLINVFPARIWIHTLEPVDAARLNQDLLAVVERERTTSDTYRADVNWQSRTDIETDEDMMEFCTYVDTAVDSVLETLSAVERGTKITGCWANVQPPQGDPHNVHMHPNNYLSGVYYLKTPPGGDTITFHDPNPHNNVIMPLFSQPSVYNSRQAILAVQPGSLLLFPAWFKHSVPKNNGESERISISFNIMFTNFDERISKPRWKFSANTSS